MRSPAPNAATETPARNVPGEPVRSDPVTRTRPVAMHAFMGGSFLRIGNFFPLFQKIREFIAYVKIEIGNFLLTKKIFGSILTKKEAAMYKLLLKSIRTEAHMTQGQLAKLLGVDIKTVGNWERGRTALNLDDACAICDVLHCTPNDLCGWYLSHPEDRPQAKPPGLTDAQQRELNELYESCGPQGKGAIIVNARGMAALEKEGDEGVPELGVGGGAA